MIPTDAPSIRQGAVLRLRQLNPDIASAWNLIRGIALPSVGLILFAAYHQTKQMTGKKIWGRKMN
jgi:hypothetical protein